MIVAAMLGALVLLALIVGLRVHALGGTRERAAPPRLRTAVVLGALVRPDGQPSDALVDRVQVAVGLLREGRVERLVLTGGSPDSRPTEAAVMAQVARQLGARDEQLVLETASRSTFDNARHCAALLHADADGEVLLVTCDFHVARAVAQFRAHSLTVWAVPSPRALDTSTRLMVTGKEVIGFLRRPWLLPRLR